MTKVDFLKILENLSLTKLALNNLENFLNLIQTILKRNNNFANKLQINKFMTTVFSP